jgi:hypothetical protein
MIDIENIVVDKVIERLTNSFENITVSSEETKTPASFPAVLIVEKSNTVYLDSRDENKENHANIMFQADIYDNDVDDKKATCKRISSELDSIMQEMGFTRTMCEPIANLEDATIYRITMRFTAVASKLMEGDVHYIYDK